MVKAKPFIIEYPQQRVMVATEFTHENGEIFKSVKEYKECLSTGDARPNTILFCPACSSGHRLAEWGFLPAPHTQRKKRKTGKCSNCGEKLTVEYYGDFDCPEVVTKKGKPFIHIQAATGRGGASFSRALKWWPVEDGKLAFESVEDLYFARTMYGKYWLEHQLLRHRHIFNLKTGHLYTMRGVDDKGQPSEHSVQKHRLQNMTFHSPNCLPSAMSHDMMGVVLQALHEYHGLDYSIETKVHDDGTSTDRFVVGKKELGVYDLGSLNYYARMKPVDIADMLSLPYNVLSKNNKRLLPNLVELSHAGEVEWLPKYMQKRSVRKRLNERVIAYFVYRWLYRCGVRDVNIMNTIVDSAIAEEIAYDGRNRSWNTTYNLTLSQVVASCGNPSTDSINFMRWALKDRSADSACKFIKSVLTPNEFTFNDSVRMYTALPDRLRPEKANGSLKDIHDALVVIDRKWRFGNREIRYSDVERSFEMDCGDYTFRLAKDTDSLYDIGKAMGICVGSYSNEAVAKRCTILTMQKAEKYIACIELHVANKKAYMRQLKSKYNHTVTEIEPIVEWVKITGINPDCYDYHSAVEHEVGRYDTVNRDYHVENPRFVNGVDVDDGINWEPDDADAELPFAPALPF